MGVRAILPLRPGVRLGMSLPVCLPVPRSRLLRPQVPRPCMQRQRGFAVLALAVTIVMIAAGVVVGWATLGSSAQSADLARAQREYLQDVQALLLAWYRRELADIDRTVPAPQVDRVVREAGIAPRWRLQLAISERLVREGVGHRVIAAWLPAPDDASMLEPDTGRFMPSTGARWVLVSGFELQARALADTRARLDRLARRLEIFYRVAYLADPSRDLAVNRFRSVDCAAPGAGELPCIDEYQPIAGTLLVARLGVEPLLERSAWGEPIEASNLLDSSSVMPHSMALRARTPWGDTLAMVAVASP